MNSNNDILDIIKSPCSESRLRLLSKSEIEQVNTRIENGKVVHYDGSVILRKIKSGYISDDNEYIFPIIEGIIILLKDLSIVDAKGFNRQGKGVVNKSKQTVIDFYNNIGWKKGKDDNFIDALKYEDLRHVAKKYIHNCHLRINRYLKPKGKYLLDAGSGPIQYQEYFSYSKGYKYRVCVDISFLALKEAKKRLGKKGIYILADLTNLPFKNDCFDGAVSLHVIYHIPKVEQKNALREIYRTLKQSSTATVVYTWPSRFSLLSTVAKIARRIGLLKKIDNKQEFYFYPQNRNFIITGLGFRVNIYVWRSLSVDFTRKYIKEYFFGRQILKIVYLLEDVFPKLMGRIGRYPLFVISKK